MSRFTVKFSILQGFYWISACFVYAFAERFLTAHGFSVQHVGFVMASANGIALLMQPLFADLADRPRGPSLKGEICALAAAGALLCMLLVFAGAWKPVIAVLFLALSTVTLTVQPMVNATGFYYVDRGDPIDYSFARGVASAAFAAYCFLAGYLAEWRIEALLWAYIAASLGMLAVALLFAPGKERAAADAVRPTGTAALLKKHPYLLPFLIGTVLTFAAHNFLNAYMFSIVRSVGGGTREMSAAVALAAVLEIPTMALFAKLCRRVRLESMLLFASAAFLVKHAILLLPLFAGTGLWSIYLSQSIQMFGYALFLPASSFYFNARMDATDKVKGQMLLTEAQTVSCILGQLVGGYSIAWIGVPHTMAIGCVLSVLGFLALLLSQKCDRAARRAHAKSASS